ncbi:MAG: hypothetical protein RLZZ612_49 [Pseudomonadota bacterium]
MNTPPPTPPTPALPHLSRLDLALRQLLHTQRVAALGSVDADGAPQVSMVPYALAHLPASCVMVLHLSGLAAHTRHLQAQAQACLMVMQAEVPDQAVHALPRVSLNVLAQTLSAPHPAYTACRSAYLARFPEAQDMTQLPDFRFVMLTVTQARHIAGFGAARRLDAPEVQRILYAAPYAPEAT